MGSTSLVCKKMTNLQKFKYLLQNLVLKQKNLETKIAKIATNYKNFLKAIDPANSNVQKICKIFKT